MAGILETLRNFWADVSGETRRRAEQLQERAEQLRDGTYYTIASDVISLGTSSIRERVSAADAAKIQRDFEHPYYSIAIKNARRYRTPGYERGYKIDNRAERHTFGPDTASKASSLETNAEDSDTARNRKRKLLEIAVGSRGDSNAAEIAHLVPHGFGCANYYLLLVMYMTGLIIPMNNDIGKERAKVLVHGLLQENGSKWVRVRNTGVKHNRANMARVFGRKAFLDTWPSLLIIPILTLDGVKQYTGGKFEAIVLASDPEVYKSCQITQELELASYPELEKAVDTLGEFVRACAFVATNGTENESYDDLLTRERNLVVQGVNGSRPAGPRMPRLMVSEDDVQSGRVRVGKVVFSMEAEDAHQETDPFALFLKAVAVESSLQGEKLLPGCPPPHDCDVCLDFGLMECHCEFHDSGSGVPEEIGFIQSENDGIGLDILE